MSNTGTTARPTVAVIGGGYGGFAAAKGLDEFADVTLVEPRDAFVHNVAALRALVEPEWLPRRSFCPTTSCSPTGAYCASGRSRSTPVGSCSPPGASSRPTSSSSPPARRYPYPAKTGTDDTATAISRYRQSHEELGAGRAGADRRRRADRARARGRDRAPAGREKRITILEPEPDILAGPYKQELRDEVRRQLDRARRRVRSR